MVSTPFSMRPSTDPFLTLVLTVPQSWVDARHERCTAPACAHAKCSDCLVESVERTAGQPHPLSADEFYAVVATELDLDCFGGGAADFASRVENSRHRSVRAQRGPRVPESQIPTSEEEDSYRIAKRQRMSGRHRQGREPRQVLSNAALATSHSLGIEAQRLAGTRKTQSPQKARQQSPPSIMRDEGHGLSSADDGNHDTMAIRPKEAQTENEHAESPNDVCREDTRILIRVVDLTTPGHESVARVKKEKTPSPVFGVGGRGSETRDQGEIT